MTALANTNREQLINVLTERLAFERAGVKLYDEVLAAARASEDEGAAKMVGQLQEHRDQEKEHEEWLEAQIRALGGDAHGETSKSRLVETESEGIEKVILSGDATLPQMFHALLAAELVDNAGWDLLVQLADEADDDQSKRAFKKRLHEEEEHLVFARRAVARFSIREVIGQPVSMPSWP
jgi:bacterioferritin (cytochrome b1)